MLVYSVSPFHYIYIECLWKYYILCILYVIYTYTQHSCVVFDTKEEHFLKMWSKDRLGIQEMDQ